MKPLRLVAIGFVISATAVACSASQPQLSTAGDPPSGNESSVGLNLQKIENSYLRCLNSGNPGVVESALGHVIYLRIAFAKADLREIETRLLDLATRGHTRAIRHKAYVAIQVFADPQAFRGALKSGNGTGDQFFADIMSRVDQ